MGYLMDYTATINGITNTVHYRDEDIEKIFLPLLREWKKLYLEKGRRVLIFLAAPPGTGKSTLLGMLKQLAEECRNHSRATESSETAGDRYPDSLLPITTIGIDGFHHYQDYLDSHTTVREGQVIKLAKIKGAPETYDLRLMEDRIRRIAAGETCGWPEYDRSIGNPREDAAIIGPESRIVVLEGNYLLLDQAGWRDLRKYADFTVKITADPKELRGRLVRRKKTSHPEFTMKQAEDFVEYSDLANARLVLAKSMEADLTLYSGADGFCPLN